MLATTSPSSGGIALGGFLYQLDISVLLALDLVLAKKVTGELTLEPVNEEDLEVDIENAPSALAGLVNFDSYKLVVQCKTRSTGPWDHADLSLLLAHGKKRMPAKDRLKDPSIRYLLITNADLQGVARQVRTSAVGLWPSADEMPAKMGSKLPPGSGGRIAVLNLMDEEKVDSRIGRLLSERFRIPHSNRMSCQEALRQEALTRMRGAANGIWRRADIERVIVAWGGYAGASDALDGFVPPTNWSELKEALETRHAVVITGASGTGKTRAGKALIADLRDKIPGLRHLYVQGGPERIYGDQSSRPVVYEIEDPWGRFRLEPTSIPWNDALNELLQLAGPDFKLVITSRSDVLHESKPRVKNKWFISLEEENYEQEQRIELFENRLPSLPIHLQSIAFRFRSEAVSRLKTPLEMHRYFAILVDGPNEQEAEKAYIERCLSDAHLSSIEAAILNAVRQREAWGWAAIVWGLFKARSRLSFAILPSIQAGLTLHDVKLEDGLERYVDFLIAGRNLRQTEAVLSYQHPRVELGLELALKERKGLATRVLTYLVDVLIALDDQMVGDWGVEGASYLIRAIRDQGSLSLELSNSVTGRLDAWLDKHVCGIGDDFRSDLELAARVGSEKCFVAEIARWLTHRPQGKTSWFVDQWSLVERSSQWYATIKADPRTKEICSAFITQELSRAHYSVPTDFSTTIEKLSDGLTPAFIELVSSLVSHGYHPNAEAAIAGAIRDLDEFENIVSVAVKYLKKQDAKPDQTLWLASSNGEYDEEAAEHYWEQEYEEGYTANEILSAYVLERREKDGWQAIRDHPHGAELLWAWLEAVNKATVVLSDEWVAIYGAVKDGSPEERLWNNVCEALPDALLPHLAMRLEAGSHNRAIRMAATKAAAHSALSLVVSTMQSLVAQTNNFRSLEFALDVANGAGGSSAAIGMAFVNARAAILEVVSGPLAESIQAIFNRDFQNLSADTVSLVGQLDVTNNCELQVVQAEVLSAIGSDVGEILDRILAAPQNTDAQISSVIRAVGIAERHQLWSIVDMALAHRFADVREAALGALARRSDGPLPSNLLALVSDKGNRVRKALLKLIRERLDPGNTDALLVLASDTWTPRQTYYGEDAHFPIALGAAELLGELPEIGDSYVSKIGVIFQKTSDRDVKLALIRALVRRGSSQAQQRVMRYVLKKGTLTDRAIAAHALSIESDHLEVGLVSEVLDKHLVAEPALVSYQLALLLAGRAEFERINAAARAVAAVSDRRALLIPLAVAANERSPALAKEIALLLPNPVADRLLAAIGGVGVFTEHELSQLGDVRTIEVVKAELTTLFPSLVSSPSDTDVVELE